MFVFICLMMSVAWYRSSPDHSMQKKVCREEPLALFLLLCSECCSDMWILLLLPSSSLLFVVLLLLTSLLFCCCCCFRIFFLLSSSTFQRFLKVENFPGFTRLASIRISACSDILDQWFYSQLLYRMRSA